jgi:hypothetical protein
MGMDNNGDMSRGSLTPITDSQADAIKAVAGLGQTVVEEGGQLARCIGRALGTTPHDAVGLVIGDPLHFIRTEWISEILRDRNVQEPQPVSPSVAIPLLRAAYDESRPELQDLWGKANRGGHGSEPFGRSSAIFHQCT